MDLIIEAYANFKTSKDLKSHEFHQNRDLRFV